MPDVFALAAIVAKFGLYLGVLTASGTILATLLFRLEGTRACAAAFALLGLLATLLAFAVQGANLTGDVSGMTDPEMLALLWSTPLGTALLLRLGGLVLLITGLFAGRLGLWVSTFGGIIAIWSFDHVGHIPSQNNALLDIALMLHLMVIALWIGILSPLKRLASTPVTHAAAAELGHRFGAVAMLTVPALIIAGMFMSYALVGSFNALFTTGYGQVLMIKVGFVAALLTLAAANKLRFVPELRSGNRVAADHLVRSIYFEWGIILAVLATTAVLTSNLTLPA